MQIGARTLGMAGRCYSMAEDYAKKRSTFGEVLARRQAVQFMLIDSQTEMHATRCMLYDAARKWDMGEETRRESMMIKLFASEMAGRVIDRAMQIHGAIGYSKNMIIEQFYRAIRAFRIFEGANEILRASEARRMLRD